ncbi:hypothetical protein JHW43_002075 [Diplocarpon mali]|nr:hypothetical protein JHW43_002075 [Diplocarpon mali]
MEAGAVFLGPANKRDARVTETIAAKAGVVNVKIGPTNFSTKSEFCDTRVPAWRDKTRTEHLATESIIPPRFNLAQICLWHKH